MSSDSSISAERLIGLGHEHLFLGAGHETNERKTRAVIVLCAVMMATEIIGGTIFGSLALIADGLHMATHVLAILIAVMAYGFARRHAADRRFTFGTGKIGDLAGFSSAIILALVALFVGYEAVNRFFAPIVIHFSEAIPIAALGFAVNLLCAWLLSGSHEHPHGHSHAQEHAHASAHSHATHRDHNFRSAFIHIIGDACVSLLAILGLLAARHLGWIWMDPVMGLVGAGVIGAWAYALIRDTGRVLVDMTPDATLEQRIRERIEADGDRVCDLHLWRLGPGHLGAIIAVATLRARGPGYYKSRLQPFTHLSHVTVEVIRAQS